MNKYVIGLVAAVGLFIAGYYLGNGSKEVVIQEKIIQKQGETRTVYKDRIITVTKEVKPDGTVTETTTTKESDKVVEKKKKETDTDSSTVVTPSLPRYSLGILAAADLSILKPEGDRAQLRYGITAGTQVLGPVWLKAGFLPQSKQVQLGIEVQL